MSIRPGCRTFWLNGPLPPLNDGEMVTCAVLFEFARAVLPSEARMSARTRLETTFRVVMVISWAFVAGRNREAPVASPSAGEIACRPGAGLAPTQVERCTL